ncbi:hypothetical protein [Natroniella sp. ANB-PHB2]|uniref:hypothetical protein n=1 Tax=Natroniella sp. ANB-PHB2 TaxID=3384444 RepID=UPI0038D3D9E4
MSIENEIFGFEYGVKPNVMVLGDIEFPTKFRQANILGIGYCMPKNILDNLPTEITLIFQNESLGKEAMQHLLDWVESSNGDGDAVGLDFIEHKKGGYTLCIYPEIDRLIDRCIPSYLREWITPLVTDCVYFKSIENLSEYYRLFKKTVKKRGSFTLCSGTVNNKFDNTNIIKKEVNFYQEDNIPKNSILKTYNCNSTEDKERMIDIDKHNFNKEQLKDVEVNRIKNLKYFFPITYEKIKKQDFLKEAINNLLKDYSESQIIQAVCNLVLFYRLKKRESIEDLFEEENYHLNILEYLLNEVEDFNSYFPSEDYLDEKIIRKQIKLDTNEMKKLTKE